MKQDILERAIELSKEIAYWEWINECLSPDAHNVKTRFYFASTTGMQHTMGNKQVNPLVPQEALKHIREWAAKQLADVRQQFEQL